MLRRRQHGQLASLQVSHRYPAAGVLAPEEGCSPHSGQHCISTGLGLAIKKDFEPGAEAVLTHLPSPLPPHDIPKVKLFHPKPSINIMFSSRWVGNMRSSTAVRLSIRLGSRTTTVTLENAFWLGLKEIARRRRIKVSDLIREIGAKRQHSNFSSELRLFVLEFYRKQACFPNQRATAGGVLSDLEPTRFERCEVIARPPRRQDRQRS